MNRTITTPEYGAIETMAFLVYIVNPYKVIRI